MAWEQKSSTDHHLIDLNATPPLEFQRPNHKSMHYLSLVKPEMAQQVLSCRGSCDERKAVFMSSHGHGKRCGERQSMELFPLHPLFRTTKSINSKESVHPLEDCPLLSPSKVEEAQPHASSSPSPHKRSFTQLTLFYNGTMKAYDVSADKAQVIMNMLAGSRSAHRLDADPNIEEGENYSATSDFSSNTPIWKAESANNNQNEASIELRVPTQRATAQIVKEINELRGADLPLSRKQSLQRFLEKRHMRQKGMAPYTTSCVNC